MKMHYADIRLSNNAGIELPVCCAGAALLDMDKSRLPMTIDHGAVTCARCIKAHAKRYPWAHVLGKVA